MGSARLLSGFNRAWERTRGPVRAYGHRRARWGSGHDPVIITILAAGQHSRLQEIVGETPKALYPLTPKGDNLLSFMLSGAKEWGSSVILLITGEYYEAFTRFCTTHALGKVKVVRANPDYVNGPIFTFLSALPAFAEKTTFVFPGDLFIAPQGYRILKDHLGKPVPCLYTQPLQPFHHGPLVQKGKILAHKDNVTGPDIEALVPIAQVTPEFVAFAQKCSKEGVTKLLDAFRSWDDQGNPLEFVSIPPFFWVDVDTPEHLTQVQNFLRKNKGK